MITCSYCGRENDEALSACRECGTDLNLVEPERAPFVFPRRTFRILKWIAPLALVIAFVANPVMSTVFLFGLFFSLPIYLPFLVSFKVKGEAWRGMRWSLRIASPVAFFIRAVGMSDRPNFGNDVGGNIAGASLNFAWTWGSGILCTVAAVIIGLLLHKIHSNRAKLASP